MKRACSDCGRPLLVKNTAREHTDWRTGETLYRCRECAERQLRAFIARTRDNLKLARLQA